jgi:Acetyltransferase (GNAT) domain
VDSPWQHSFSLFQEPWWLDAVAPSAWEEVRIEQNGELLARWPFVVKRRYGITALTVPPLTPSLGPWLAPTIGKYSTQLARQKELLLALFDRLPRHDLIRAPCAPEFTNWLPLFWRGFTVHPACTYRITDLSNEDGVWNEFSQTIRRAVRKRQKEMAVEIGEEIDTLISLNQKTLVRQANKVDYNGDLLRRLFEACNKSAGAKVLLARDGKGCARAGALVVWDSRIAYYLVGGLDLAYNDSQAMSLVLWEAIRLACRVSTIFDFEGSMVESIEHFFRHFGGQQTNSFCLERYGRKVCLVRGMRALASAWNNGPSTEYSQKHSQTG